VVFFVYVLTMMWQSNSLPLLFWIFC